MVFLLKAAKNTNLTIDYSRAFGRMITQTTQDIIMKHSNTLIMPRFSVPVSQVLELCSESEVELFNGKQIIRTPLRVVLDLELGLIKSFKRDSGNTVADTLSSEPDLDIKDYVGSNPIFISDNLVEFSTVAISACFYDASNSIIPISLPTINNEQLDKTFLKDFTIKRNVLKLSPELRALDLDGECVAVIEISTSKVKAITKRPHSDTGKVISRSDTEIEILCLVNDDGCFVAGFIA